MIVNMEEASVILKEALTYSTGFDFKSQKFKFRFAQPVREDERYLHRTHPFVETLANHVLETALDPLSDDAKKYPAARRCGAIRTKNVNIRTTLLLIRFRYHIIQIKKGEERPLLAEECCLTAFTGSPQNAKWISNEEAESLLSAAPESNITPEQAADCIKSVVDDLTLGENKSLLMSQILRLAKERGEELLAAHQRVQRSSKVHNIDYMVKPNMHPDVLGIFIYLPNP